MIPEYKETIPTLWSTVQKFMDDYPNFVHENNTLDMFLTSSGV